MQPHRQQPTRLLHPWDSPGKNTGVSCHFLLQCMKVKSESEVTQSCLTLRDPMDCSPPGSSIHGSFQARVLEWGAIAFSMLRTGQVQMSLTSKWISCGTFMIDYDSVIKKKLWTMAPATTWIDLKGENDYKEVMRVFAEAVEMLWILIVIVMTTHRPIHKLEFMKLHTHTKIMLT